MTRELQPSAWPRSDACSCARPCRAARLLLQLDAAPGQPAQEPRDGLTHPDPGDPRRHPPLGDDQRELLRLNSARVVGIPSAACS